VRVPTFEKIAFPYETITEKVKEGAHTSCVPDVNVGNYPQLSGKLGNWLCEDPCQVRFGIAEIARQHGEPYTCFRGEKLIYQARGPVDEGIGCGGLFEPVGRPKTGSRIIPAN
jgi:hypothetical protein